MPNLLQRTLAAAALALALPLFGIIALAVALESGAPVFFRQARVGERGRMFRLIKFRSMFRGTTGPAITGAGDTRITAVGRILRRFKLDELPQLWNVVRGDMALVGPRPEVPRYVDHADPRWRTVLSVKPGITELASLAFRDEEQLLAGAADAESFYRETLLPAKLAVSMQYISMRSASLDCRILFWTVLCSFLPFAFDARKAQRSLSTRHST